MRNKQNQGHAAMNSAILIKFRAHVLNIGYGLLREDYAFIEKHLQNTPQNEQRLILRRYLDEWVHGMGETEKTHQKQNLGRFRANSFLRSINKN